jgi:hypothetical protein
MTIVQKDDNNELEVSKDEEGDKCRVIDWAIGKKILKFKC